MRGRGFMMIAGTRRVDGCLSRAGRRRLEWMGGLRVGVGICEGVDENKLYFLLLPPFP